MSTAHKTFSESTIIFWICFGCAHLLHIWFNFTCRISLPHVFGYLCLVWINSLCAPLVLSVFVLALFTCEPIMGSQMIPVSISGTCVRLLPKDIRHWNPCQSMLLYIPKTQTCPLNHNQCLRPCGLHQQPMRQLYIAHQCTIALIHCVRHK